MMTRHSRHGNVQRQGEWVMVTREVTSMVTRIIRKSPLTFVKGLWGVEVWVFYSPPPSVQLSSNTSYVTPALTPPAANDNPMIAGVQPTVSKANSNGSFFTIRRRYLASAPTASQAWSSVLLSCPLAFH